MPQFMWHFCVEHPTCWISLVLIRISRLYCFIKLRESFVVLSINMFSIFLIICLTASIRMGWCTPVRMLLDANTRDTPELTESWHLWDTDGGQFSMRIPQLDVYHPTIGQPRNIGKYSTKFTDNLLSPNSESKPLPTWQTNCDNLGMNEGNFLDVIGIVRCRRITLDWMVPEPFYVNEPRYLPIELNQGDTPMSPLDDPFIIARGKRSVDHHDKMNSSKAMNSVRRKRDVLTDMEIKEFREIPRMIYVEPRDKHSDIMDMLQEPFFISRGKKSKSRKEDVHGATKLELPLIRNYRTARDRRGDIMEQLLKEQDPFFIARGRRAVNTF